MNLGSLGRYSSRQHRLFPIIITNANRGNNESATSPAINFPRAVVRGVRARSRFPHPYGLTFPKSARVEGSSVARIERIEARVLRFPPVREREHASLAATGKSIPRRYAITAITAITAIHSASITGTSIKQLRLCSRRRQSAHTRIINQASIVSAAQSPVITGASRSADVSFITDGSGDLYAELCRTRPLQFSGFLRPVTIDRATG